MKHLVAIALLGACGSKPARVDPPPPPPPVIAPASPGIELPEVSSVGYAGADTVQPKIAVSPTAFTIEGQQAFALRDGAFAAGDAAKLASAIDTSVATGVPGVALAFDRRVPFATFADTVRALHDKGTSRFRLLARAGAAQVEVAFERVAPPAPLDPAAPFVDDGQRRPYKGDPIGNLYDDVDEAASDLARCLPEDDKQRDQVRGRIVLQFVVTAKGDVEHLKLSGAGQPYFDCFTKAIGRWHFGDLPHAVGFHLAFALPWFNNMENPAEPPADNTKKQGGFHTEIRNGKKVTVIDTVVVHGGPVEPVVTITDKHFLVWSRRNLHSTRDKPAATIDRTAKTAIADLDAALGELARKEFWDGKRFPIDQQIVVEVVDPAAQMQLVAEVLGTLQVANDGFPLFTQIRLAVK